MFVSLLLWGFLEQLMTGKYDDGDDEMSIEYANVCNADDDDVKEGDVRDWEEQLGCVGPQAARAPAASSCISSSSSSLWSSSSA